MSERTVELDRDAIERAQVGDSAALEELLTAYEPHLRNIARKMSGTQRSGYMDVLQEARTLFAERVVSMDPASIGDGLFGVRTQHFIKDGLLAVSDVVDGAEYPKHGPKSVNRVLVLPDHDDDGMVGTTPSAEDVLIEQEDAEFNEALDDMTVAMYLCVLSDKQAEVVRFWLDRPGLSHREIARQMGLPQKTYDERWSRAMERLRDKFGGVA